MFRQQIHQFTTPFHIFDVSKLKQFHLSIVFIRSFTQQWFFHQEFRLQNLCTWAIVPALVFGIGNSAVAADFEPIVYSGQLAVGAPPGATHTPGFTNASDPALGDDSSVYYTSGLIGAGTGTGVGQGLWRANTQGTTAFWTVGDPAPGTPVGTTFRNTFDIVPNGVGQTAFLARVAGTNVTNSNDAGIWAGAPGSFGLVAREGDPAPGTSSTYTGGFIRLVYNNAGQVAFQDRFEGNSRLGIWSGTPGSIQAVALEGTPAPGFGSDATFGNLSPANHPLALNNNGKLAFFSEIFTPPGPGSSRPDTIWTGKPGAISAVVVEDQVAPGTGGKLFSSLGKTVDINDNGAIGFRATLSGDRDSAWFGDADDLSLIAQRNDSAPGLADDVIFKSFVAPLINDQGKFALLANVGEEGTARSETSLWIGSDESLELIVKRRDQVPGFADGTSFSIFRNVNFNNSGQVAFDGVFSGSESGTAIFATDGTDEYSLVAKAGDIVNLDGEMRTISSLTLFDSVAANSPGRLTGSSDGRASSFNDEGDLMFFAKFEEGGAGIFLTNVPAIPLPPAFVFFVSGFLGLLGLRRGILKR